MVYILVYNLSLGPYNFKQFLISIYGKTSKKLYCHLTEIQSILLLYEYCRSVGRPHKKKIIYTLHMHMYNVISHNIA